ncbi:helix-hairpin-helix domain-containing protein [Paenibacillus rhizophilus]|uniref:DNA-binding protein n=1 Tax=Paenibacillus rhizophilus TaxID=1850366 RepID=A0A3N9Q0S6_9BACL|nr:helix-hairpin-helix domain-containing protein [Paenibacillus rhizophilus]RQW12302.1 DNA-binding protein [Paenibacillus rhizophilus]
MEEHDIAGPQSGFPEKLSKPARRALQGAGYLTLEQLAEAGEAELLKLHGMGPKALDQLRQAMTTKGLHFADKTKG